MTPEEIKAAARKELARRELARREMEKRGAAQEPLVEEPPIPAPRGIPQEFGVGRTLRPFGEAALGVVEGLPLGYGEEVGSIGSTIAGKLGVEGFSPSYEENLARSQQTLSEIPIGTRTTGNVLGALASGRFVPAPQTLGQAIGYGMGGGALAGSGFAEGGPEERLKGAAAGAATGGVVAAPLYGLSNVIAPRVGQALQTLRKEGVRPTIGQMAGGAAGRLEESAMSVPVVGQFVRSARLRALEDFNRGAINHALRPAGLSIKAGTDAGRKAIAEADDLLSKGYSDALDQITDASVDSTFAQQIQRLSGIRDQRLGRKGQRAFDNAIEDVLSNPAMQKPAFSGREIKRAISGLRRDAERLLKNTDEDTYQAGLLVREARDALSDLMKRNTTPENASRLTGLDRAFAGFQRVRSASEAGREGIFTPFQLTQAIKRGEKASGSRGFARGEGLGQELAEAAEEVISSRVPDSGTPERLAPYLIGGGLGAGYISPYAAAAGAATIGPYTRIGQNFLASLAARPSGPGSQVLAGGLRRLAVPAAIPAAAASGSQ